MKQRYEIIDKIGEGKFGNVYRGIYYKPMKDGKLREQVAIKVGETLNQLQVLKNETTVLHYLHSNGCRQIPHIIWYGRLDPIGSMGFIMPLYECSLHEYRKMREFTPPIVKSIMIQAISILESIHKLYVIHRDIKPQNFMIKDGELYLIDFGFATFYVNSEKQHISIDCSQESILGTPKYISLYNHMGMSSSRRDDMISLGYIMFYFRAATAVTQVPNSASHYPFGGHCVASEPPDTPSCHSGITPFRIEDAQSNRSNPFISAHNVGILNENWCKNDSGYNKPDEKMLENPGGYERSHILHPMNQQLKKEKEIGVIENLCKEGHPEIYYYLKTCYEIEYHETPDYSFLRELFT